MPIKQASFGGMTDYQAEQERIKQEKLLAQAMLMQGLRPMSQPGAVGGIPIKQSPWEGVAQLARTGFGKYGTMEADKAARSMAQQQQQQADTWIQSLIAAMQGTPGSPASTVEGSSVGPPAGDYGAAGNVISGQMGPDEPVTTPPIPGQAPAGKNEMLAQLLAGMRNPQTAPVANSMLAQMLKGKEYSDTPRYDQSGRAFVVSKDGTIKYLDGVKARDKMEAFNFGGTTGFANPYNINPGTVIPHTAAPESASTVANRNLVPGPNGAFVPNAPLQQFKASVASAGAPKTTINMPQEKALGAYARHVGEGAAKRDETQFNVATAAPATIQKLDEVLNHLKTSDAITGPGAEIILGFEKLKTVLLQSEKAGKRVADTQILDAFLGSDVFPLIKSLGIGARGMDTPAEREFLRAVMTGTPNMQKAALIKLTEDRRNIAMRNVETWNKRVKSGELNKFFELSQTVPKTTIEMPAPSGGWRDL